MRWTLPTSHAAGALPFASAAVRVRRGVQHLGEVLDATLVRDQLLELGHG